MGQRRVERGGKRLRGRQRRGRISRACTEGIGDAETRVGQQQVRHSKARYTFHPAGDLWNALGHTRIAFLAEVLRAEHVDHQAVDQPESFIIGHQPLGFTRALDHPWFLCRYGAGLVCPTHGGSPHLGRNRPLRYAVATPPHCESASRRPDGSSSRRTTASSLRARGARVVPLPVDSILRVFRGAVLKTKTASTGGESRPFAGRLIGVLGIYEL